MNLLNLPWKDFENDERAIFIYNLDRLRERSHSVKASLSSWTKNPNVVFSVKSNPNPRILRCLENVLDGFDVSSEAELRLCQRLGVASGRISVSGPGKTDACLKLAKQMSVHALHADSKDELEAAQDLQIANISLRIHTPDIFSAKLGFTEEDLSAALKALKMPAIGLHLYMGREAFSWERLDEAAQKMKHWFTTKKKSFATVPEYFVGPGIPATWAAEPAPKLTEEVSPMTFEVGRGVVGDCGYYAVPVLARKQLDRGGEALIVHGGLQHLGSPFVSFAQRVHELQCQVIRNGTFVESAHTSEAQEFLIAGSLCLGHDILHPRMKLSKDIRRGDWLVFPRAGAYGLSAGVPFFIGQDLPKEVIFERGQFEDVTLQEFKLYHECFDLPLKGTL